MKTLLTGANDRVAQFETIYKTMLGSDDYHPKRTELEKKMRRIAQLRSDCGKFSEDKEDIERVELQHQDTDLEGIEDVEELQEIVRESERIGHLLDQDVAELQEIGKGLEKRRAKIADADVRQISLKRKEELSAVADELKAELNKLTELEQALTQKSQELKGDKQANAQKAIKELKSQFDNFKRQYEMVEDEIRNVTIDISSRELETVEPVTKLGRDIEKLKQSKQQIKTLKTELEKI